MQPVWEFEELHVVSDLHLGGSDGHQIFGMTDRLVRLIDYCDSRAKDNRVGFVINGDFVDFLAEKDAIYFDPDGAKKKLKRIVEDATFSPIFKKLQSFALNPKARLLVNIGNHDIELALPWVRESLLTHLSGDDPVARSHIILETSGSGILCEVANARVLCVHGNEVDDWNLNDYEAIRRISTDRQYGFPSKSWIPNAGTQLVIDVMNEIKREKFPFVDLLKPETEGVVPALLALEPPLLSKIPSIAPAARRRFWDGVRRTYGFLSREEPALSGDILFSPGEPATERMRQVQMKRQRELKARALVVETERRFKDEDSPADLFDAENEMRNLGLTTALWKRIMLGDTAEALREALRPLAKDRSFCPFEEDKTYRDLDKKISYDIDILIAGHTHLERFLPRKEGRGVYYNTGTWARLIQVTEADLKTPESFKRYFDALTAKTMKALDDTGVVLNRPTIASVWSENEIACAELRHIPKNPSDDVFEPSDKTTFFRKA